MINCQNQFNGPLLLLDVHFQSFSNMTFKMSQTVIFSRKRLSTVFHGALKGPHSRVQGHVAAQIAWCSACDIAHGAFQGPTNVNNTKALSHS